MGTTANITSGRNPHGAETASRTFTGLSELERSTGVPAANLLKVLEVELSFHSRVLTEEDSERRRGLYRELYAAVHPLLASDRSDSTYFERMAKLFASELRNKSVLDLGCGDGSLLRAIAKHGSPAALTGIDIHPFGQVSDGFITFTHGDVIRFTVSRPVDVAISSQVVEHLAPADLNEHVRSVRNSLVENGTFIVLTPNRLWGPHDITRVYDFTSSNRVAAQGSHLNELTYRELMTVLHSQGFEKLTTVLPFADRLPGLRLLRLRPFLNLSIENNPSLRQLTYFIKRRGRAVYKNPIVLIARKA